MIDDLRLITNNKLDPANKAIWGQFMTPSCIADYMASLFDKTTDNIKLLDCGAGIGSLTIAALKALETVELVDLWEIDPIMQAQLKQNLTHLALDYSIHSQDFISEAVTNICLGKGQRYTHAILNPPYRKINNNSEHRKLLRKVGIETVNLYSAFLALTIKLMAQGGQIVAIIPRSFCNGAYYKAFRALLLKNCAIEHIHVFKSRNKAFQDDAVLQENIILKLVKHKPQGLVSISQSDDPTFQTYESKTVPFTAVVKANDPEYFIHIPITASTDNHKLFAVPLSELGLNVSTGPVVDFRLKEFLEHEPTAHTVPLIYPHHFVNGQFHYPKTHKKPNAIQVVPASQKWLMPNDGFYVIVKRFSSKEERQRVVAYIVNPDEIAKAWIGFENHWNVFHVNKHGFDKTMAMGLACFLNSSLLDNHFRVFSGHTQVNATDLKNLRYPTLQTLLVLGQAYQTTMTQAQIDQLLGAVA